MFYQCAAYPGGLQYGPRPRLRPAGGTPRNGRTPRGRKTARAAERSLGGADPFSQKSTKRLAEDGHG